MHKLLDSDDPVDKAFNYIIFAFGIALLVYLFVWAVWFKYHEGRDLEWALLGNFSFMCTIHQAKTFE